MLKVLVINKVTREQYVCQDINHLQQLLNAGADEIVRYLVDLTYKPSWVDSEWIIELSKVDGALIEGIDIYAGKNIIVLDYVGRRRIIYDDIASAYDDNLLDISDIVRCLTCKDRDGFAKYIGGYEFFYLDNLNLKQLPPFLNITVEQTLNDKSDYIRNKVEQLLHYNGSESIDMNSLWVSAKYMSQLFGKHINTIYEHIQTIYTQKELIHELTCKKIPVIYNRNGKAVYMDINHYNTDMFIAVGDRVHSSAATYLRNTGANIIKQRLGRPSR